MLLGCFSIFNQAVWSTNREDTLLSSAWCCTSNV
jgi:hypothetical protein